MRKSSAMTSDTYPTSVDTVQVGKRYRGHMPQVGPTHTWNELRQSQDDIVLIHTPEGQASQVVTLDALFEGDKSYKAAQEEAPLIKFMLSHRERFAEKLFKEAGLIRKVEWNLITSYEVVRYIEPQPNIVTDYPYLLFAFDGWRLRLNSSQTPLAFAAWNDLLAVSRLIASVSDPIEELALRLALSNPQEAAARTKKIALAEALKNQVFDHGALEVYLKYEKLESFFTAEENGNRVFTGRRDWIDLKPITGMTSGIIAIDYIIDIHKAYSLSFMDRFISGIRDLGGEWVDVGRRDLDLDANGYDRHSHEVLYGVIVKDAKFFQANRRLFFDPNLGRRSALAAEIGVLNMAGGTPTIAQIEEYFGCTI